MLPPISFRDDGQTPDFILGGFWEGELELFLSLSSPQSSMKTPGSDEHMYDGGGDPPPLV